MSTTVWIGITTCMCMSVAGSNVFCCLLSVPDVSQTVITVLFLTETQIDYCCKETCTGIASAVTVCGHSCCAPLQSLPPC